MMAANLTAMCIELLAKIERTRRLARVSEIQSARLGSLVDVAEAVASQALYVAEAASERELAVAEYGIPAEAITPEAVLAWARVNLDGGRWQLWDWDGAQDLPVSMVQQGATND